jgi:hypothetical protein
MKTFIEQVLSGDKSPEDLHDFIRNDCQDYPGSPRDALGLTLEEYQRWGRAVVNEMDDIAVFADIIKKRRY